VEDLDIDDIMFQKNERIRLCDAFFQFRMQSTDKL
jgi:hypothetical protein